jgi:hypothetical protein
VPNFADTVTTQEVVTLAELLNASDKRNNIPQIKKITSFTTSFNNLNELQADSFVEFPKSLFFLYVLTKNGSFNYLYKKKNALFYNTIDRKFYSYPIDQDWNSQAHFQLEKTLKNNWVFNPALTSGIIIKKSKIDKIKAVKEAANNPAEINSDIKSTSIVVPAVNPGTVTELTQGMESGSGSKAAVYLPDPTLEITNESGETISIVSKPGDSTMNENPDETYLEINGETQYEKDDTGALVKVEIAKLDDTTGEIVYDADGNEVTVLVNVPKRDISLPNTNDQVKLLAGSIIADSQDTVTTNDTTDNTTDDTNNTTDNTTNNTNNTTDDTNNTTDNTTEDTNNTTDDTNNTTDNTTDNTNNTTDDTNNTTDNTTDDTTEDTHDTKSKSKFKKYMPVALTLSIGLVSIVGFVAYRRLQK